MGVGPVEHRNQGYGWKEGHKDFSQLVWMAQSDWYNKSYSQQSRESYGEIFIKFRNSLRQTYTDRH
eukprot:scaffold26027_cov70-Attheya_sp.AAC.7